MGGARRIGWILLLSALSCGDDPTDTGVDTDALAAHCDARCSFQATCVPELLAVIGECKKQCRNTFEDPELYTGRCTTPDIR